MPLGFAVFNDLSCVAAAHDKRQLIDLCDRLLIAFKRANQMGISRMRTRSDFVAIMSSDGCTLHDAVLALPFEKRNLLLSILDCPYIKDTEHREVDLFLGINISTVNGHAVPSAEGLIASYVHKSPSVSMLSDAQWDANSVEIEFSSAPGGPTSLEHIRHASREVHFDSLIVDLGLETLRALGLTPTHDEPLPNTAFAKNILARGDWQRVAAHIRQRSNGERIAFIGPFAHTLARINGYVFEQEITSQNQRAFNSYRQVFSFGEAAHKLYLSTDFEKGAFEVCDKDGCHLGEFLFSGVRSSGPDTTGRHNLII